MYNRGGDYYPDDDYGDLFGGGIFGDDYWFIIFNNLYISLYSFLILRLVHLRCKSSFAANTLDKQCGQSHPFFLTEVMPKSAARFRRLPVISWFELLKSLIIKYLLFFRPIYVQNSFHIWCNSFMQQILSSLSFNALHLIKSGPKAHQQHVIWV